VDDGELGKDTPFPPSTPEPEELEDQRSNNKTLHKDLVALAAEGIEED
jgi:hypothetical protein